MTRRACATRRSLETAGDMAKKSNAEKAAKAERKRLEAEVEKLRAKVSAAEAEAARWRKKAKKHKAAATGAFAETTELKRVLEDPSRAALAEAFRAADPDTEWTVAALRAEARSRGLAGYSRMTKAQLLGPVLG